MGQGVCLRLKVVWLIEEQIVYSCDLRGNAIVRHAVKHDWGETLVQVRDLLYLPVTYRGGDRIRADDEDNSSIGFTDEAQQFAPPVLEFWKIAHIDLRIELTKFKRADDLLRKSEIRP